MRVLFVNHTKERCGVQQFGQRIGHILSRSTSFDFHYLATENDREFLKVSDTISPDVVIYNWYPSTMPWASPRFVDNLRNRFIQVGIFHEVMSSHFDYYIHADPTIVNGMYIENKEVFITGRPLYFTKETLFQTRYLPNYSSPIIGTFGFGFGDKGYQRIIHKVEEEFDNATINFHISFAEFGDSDGRGAMSWDYFLREEVKKSGIVLNITHEFLSNQEILNFLNGNDINVFMYDENYGRGISSATDYALSVPKPIAISKSYMFRHLWETTPSILLEERSLLDIMKSGITPLQPYYEQWSNEEFIKDYERILEQITSR